MYKNLILQNAILIKLVLRGRCLSDYIFKLSRYHEVFIGAFKFGKKFVRNKSPKLPLILFFPTKLMLNINDYQGMNMYDMLSTMLRLDRKNHTRSLGTLSNTDEPRISCV